MPQLSMLDVATFLSFIRGMDIKTTVEAARVAAVERIINAEERVADLAALASQMLDMLERVEWVRAQAGWNQVCPFCHAVSERDDGPGHQDECEWQAVTREGNELRVAKVLR